MSMSKQVIRKLMSTAVSIGYSVESVFDGEETLKVIGWETTPREIVDFATATDEAVIKFNAGPDKQFYVYLAFDNSPEEMIYDHTDNAAAGSVCIRVADHFSV